jgi:hypothetical protein
VQEAVTQKLTRPTAEEPPATTTAANWKPFLSSRRRSSGSLDSRTSPTNPFACNTNPFWSPVVEPEEAARGPREDNRGREGTANGSGKGGEIGMASEPSDQTVSFWAREVHFAPASSPYDASDPKAGAGGCYRGDASTSRLLSHTDPSSRPPSHATFGIFNTSLTHLHASAYADACSSAAAGIFNTTLLATPVGVRSKIAQYQQTEAAAEHHGASRATRATRANSAVDLAAAAAASAEPHEFADMRRSAATSAEPRELTNASPSQVRYHTSDTLTRPSDQTVLAWARGEHFAANTPPTLGAHRAAYGCGLDDSDASPNLAAHESYAGLYSLIERVGDGGGARVCVSEQARQSDRGPPLWKMKAARLLVGVCARVFAQVRSPQTSACCCIFSVLTLVGVCVLAYCAVAAAQPQQDTNSRAAASAAARQSVSVLAQHQRHQEAGEGEQVVWTLQHMHLFYYYTVPN